MSRLSVLVILKSQFTRPMCSGQLFSTRRPIIVFVADEPMKILRLGLSLCDVNLDKLSLKHVMLNDPETVLTECRFSSFLVLIHLSQAFMIDGTVIVAAF